MCSLRNFDLRANSSSCPVELKDANRWHLWDLSIKLNKNEITLSAYHIDFHLPISGYCCVIEALDRYFHLSAPFAIFTLISLPLVTARGQASFKKCVGWICHWTENVQQTNQLKLKEKKKLMNINSNYLKDLPWWRKRCISRESWSFLSSIGAADARPKWGRPCAHLLQCYPRCRSSSTVHNKWVEIVWSAGDGVVLFEILGYWDRIVDIGSPENPIGCCIEETDDRRWSWYGCPLR